MTEQTDVSTSMTRTKNSIYERTKDGHFICPECKREDFTAPQGVGSHMKMVHGIKGKSPSTLAYKAKKKEQKRLGKPMKMFMTKEELSKKMKDVRAARKDAKTLKGPKNIPCPFPDCGKMNKNPLGYKYHVARTHGVTPIRGESYEELTARVNALLGKTNIQAPQEGQAPTAVPPIPQTIQQIAGVNRCPECGCNLEAHNLLHALLKQGEVNQFALAEALKLAFARAKNFSKV